MPTGAFGSLTAAVKEVYSPKYVEPMVNNARPFTRWLETSLPNGNVHRKGGTFKFYGVTDPPMNMAYIADATAYPVPKDRTPIQFTLVPVLIGGTSQIGEMMRHVVDSDVSGWNGGELRQRLDETILDAAKHMERCYAGTHGTGRLGTVTEAGANTFTVDEPYGVQLVRENMMISVRTADGGDTAVDTIDYRKITKIVRSTRTVTYDGADQNAGTSNYHLHLVSAASQTSLSTVNPNGIRGLVDNATYLATVHALARGTYVKLNANVDSNAGTNREISEGIIDRLINEIYHTSGTYPTDIWTSPDQARMIFKFMSADRRVVTSGGVPSYKAGWTDALFGYRCNGGEIPLHTAPDIVPREMYLLNRDHLFRYVAKPLGWWDAGVGEGGLLPVAGTNTYNAAWFMATTAIENIGCNNFLAQGVIRDLRDPLFDGAM